MSDRNKQYRKGFTLVEVLAGALVSLQGIVNQCLYRARLNEERERAWQVLDQQMTAIDAMGIDSYMQEPLKDGEIEKDGIRFHWQVDTSVESIDCIYEVTVTIWWGAESKPHVISATTRLNGMIPAVAANGGAGS